MSGWGLGVLLLLVSVLLVIAGAIALTEKGSLWPAMTVGFIPALAVLLLGMFTVALGETAAEILERLTRSGSWEVKRR